VTSDRPRHQDLLRAAQLESLADLMLDNQLLVVGMIAAGWMSFRALVRFFDHKQARRR
jgi:hypothetical protein